MDDEDLIELGEASGVGDISDVRSVSDAPGKRRKRHFRKHRKLKIFLIVVACAVAALAIAFTVYVSDYYHATDTALAAIEDPQGYTVEELSDGSYAFLPEGEATAGLIFYPGAKVQYQSYAPLMADCAKQGIACILVDMPFNLAIFGQDKADSIIEEFPQISRWYIGGHSFGGVVAAMYADGHDDELDGIVLLASYPSVDLSDNGLEALSMVGTEDGVINRENYDDSKAKLPIDTIYVTVVGGNHAGFGNYGAQDGDGEASISAEQQQLQAADDIAALVAN